MLSTNYFHCLLLKSDVALVISSFVVDGRARWCPACVGCLAPSWPGSPLGIVACIAYVFQWGYDRKQPSIVSLGTTSRLSGNQLEDDGSSLALYLVPVSAPVSLLNVDVGSVPGGR